MKPGIFPREHNNNRPSFLISPPDGNAPLINWKSGADQSQKSPSSICAYDKIKIACREMQLPSPKKKYIYMYIYIIRIPIYMCMPRLAWEQCICYLFNIPHHRPAGLAQRDVKLGNLITTIDGCLLELENLKINSCLNMSIINL